MLEKKKVKQTIIKSNTEQELAHATIKEAVQKRIIPADHSSIIPGIDVNELKHSLDLLKYALDYSEAIVDSVKVPLIVLNKSLEVLTANRSFYDTFKLTPKQTENHSIYKLNNNAWDIPKLRELLEKILPANTHLDNYKVEINLPNIGQRVMLLNARRTYRQVNNTEAILLGFEDITDREQLEKQKDDFIGIVSHELKTPLTTIKAFSQLLEKHLESDKDEKGSFLLSKMTQQMERLSQLMASFVNVYQIQTGKLALKKKHFEMEALINETILDFSYTTTTHKINYTSDINTVVFADRERISQVLINYISNAIKYSPLAKKIVIKSIIENDNITISVKDYGPGIPKEVQTKVFDRFFRIKNGKASNIPGLGLGLYISNEIIEAHKGKTWVESQEGKGATFYFTIPIK